MKIAPLADVKARLSAYLDECGVEGPVVITRNGKAAGVLLVPYDDDDLERLMLGRSPRFQALLNRSRQSIKEGKGLSEDAFWAAVRKRAQQRRADTVKKRRASRNSD
jgi:prevent-host-death family protein